MAPSVISQSRQPVPLQISVLNPSPPDNAGRDIAAVAAAILTWVSISLYGTVIANGVAQEKTSRTAEVLLATVRPGQLLNGKVLGIGACGIGQMVITIGAGLIANSIVHATQIPTVLWQLLPAVLLWFLLGYALYSYAFAAAGSMVARQEELQLVTSPFAVLLVGAVSAHIFGNRVAERAVAADPVVLPSALACSDAGEDRSRSLGAVGASSGCGDHDRVHSRSRAWSLCDLLLCGDARRPEAELARGGAPIA